MLNFSEIASGPQYQNASTPGPQGGGGGSGSGNGGGGGGPSTPGSATPSGAGGGNGNGTGSDTENDQIKSMMDLQHSQLPGGYVYRNPYNPQSDPPGFNRNHLTNYPFPSMQNSYTGYHHLGYPGSSSPVGEGKQIIFNFCAINVESHDITHPKF